MKSYFGVSVLATFSLLFSGCTSVDTKDAPVEQTSADAVMCNKAMGGGIRAANFYAGADAEADTAVPEMAKSAVNGMARTASPAPADTFAVSEVMMPEGRQMIFTADYSLAVTDIPAAQKALIALVKELNGYVQQQNTQYMTIRIPVAQADAALNAVENLGVMIDHRISGQDVTEEMTDVKIRLDNLEILRQRLQKLSERFGNVNELLNVERELSRVTTEIERLKGRMQLLSNQVQYVTINIDFSEQRPQLETDIDLAIPIEWVAQLGGELAKNPPVMAKPKMAFDVTLPSDFVLVASRQNPQAKTSYAINADGAVLKLTRRADLKHATDKFWADIIARSLAESARLTNIEVRDLTTNEQMPATAISGNKKLGNLEFHYQILLVRFDDELYLYEFWAPLSVFSPLLESVENSYQQYDLSFWN